jgi:hypothetical protein
MDSGWAFAAQPVYRAQRGQERPRCSARIDQVPPEIEPNFGEFVNKVRAEQLTIMNTLTPRFLGCVVRAQDARIVCNCLFRCLEIRPRCSWPAELCCALVNPQ